MNGLQEFLQEEGWMHITAIFGAFLIALIMHLYEKWRSGK
jgi:hypothetical protein